MGLRERRVEQGLTQAVLAHRCGCTAQYISMVERGVWEPSDRLLAKMRNVLYGERNKTGPHPKVPFANEAEQAEFRRVWCTRYEGDDRRPHTAHRTIVEEV